MQCQLLKLRVQAWFLPILHPKMTWMPPNSVQIVYHNYRVLLGWFGSHFGAILGPFGTSLSQFGSQIASSWSPFGADFLPKMAWIPPKLSTVALTIHGGSLWGQFWGDLVHLGPFGVHLGPIWLPHSTIWANITSFCSQKGPSWPFIRTNGWTIVWGALNMH